MKISKLIKILFAMMKRYGDIEVYLRKGNKPAESVSIEKVSKKNSDNKGSKPDDVLFID